MNEFQNPYSVDPYAEYNQQMAANATDSARAIFIKRTYLHLALGIIGFTLLQIIGFSIVPAENLSMVAGVLMGWPGLIVLGVYMLVSWLAHSNAAQATNRSTQYFWFGAFVLVEAAIFFPLLCITMLPQLREFNILPAAAIITLTTFGGLTAVTLLSRKDFSFLGRIISMGFFLMLGVMVFGLFFPGQLQGLGLWISVAFIGISCAAILYETSNVLHHYRTDQDVVAGMALFASLATLFWHVIMLLIHLSSND